MEYHYLLLILFIVIIFILCIITYFIYDASKKTYFETLLSFLIIASLFITLCFYYVTIETQSHNYDITRQDNTKKCNKLLNDIVNIKDLQKYNQEDLTNARNIFSYWDSILSLSQHSTLNTKIITRRLIHFSFNDQIKEIWTIYRKQYHKITKQCGDLIFENVNILNNSDKILVKQLKAKLITIIKSQKL